MDVFEFCDWVGRVTQVPNVETWILVIVICHDKLEWYFWVPHHPDLGCLIVLLLVRWIAEEAVVGLVFGLHELEDRF